MNKEQNVGPQGKDKNFKEINIQNLNFLDLVIKKSKPENSEANPSSGQTKQKSKKPMKELLSSEDIKNFREE